MAADRSPDLRYRTAPSDEEYKQIEFQKRLRLRAEEHAGIKPPFKLTHEELLSYFESRVLSNDEGASFSSSGYNLTEYYIEPYPPSYKSINELHKITLDDLKLETRHSGTVIFLKTINNAKRISTVTVIVEDENGVPGQLQIFNLGRNLDLDDFLPPGQIICVKEPLFRFSSTAIPSIRVDHPGDLVFVEEDDGDTPEAWKVEEIERTAKECKEIGNQAVRDGKLKDAIRWYTKGLKILSSEPEEMNMPLKLALLLNRSLTYLRLEDYESSLRDSEAALFIDHSNEKGLFRKAKALYHLRRYAKCGNTLTKLANYHPDSQEAKHELAIVRQRLLEEMRGEYDWAKMVKMAKNDFPGQDFDFADYTLPVCVKKSSISGNGLFAKKNIRMGELILVCKAFANCKKGENGISAEIDPVTNHIYQRAGAFLPSAILEKVRKTPGALKEISNLYTSFPKKAVDGTRDGVVDAFLIKDICHRNSYSSCSYYDEFPEMREDQEDPQNSRNPVKDNEYPFDPNSGFWILPSYINHSCIPNSRRTFLGDMMILRAVVDIPKDSELLLTYTDNRLSYESRSQMLGNSWKFRCSCKLCEFQSAPGISEGMEAIMAKMHALITKVGEEPATAEEAEELKCLILELESWYIFPAHIVPRCYLGEHILRLYFFYNGLGLAQQAFKALHAAPPAFGAIFAITEEDGVVFRHKGWVDADLVRAYVRLAAVTGIMGGKIADDWRKAARDAYRVVVGEDDTFEDTFGEVIWRYIKDDNKKSAAQGKVQ